jgi:hypothetical protein
MEMDRVPLWRGDHVALGQLVEDFGRYLYLPRLQTTTVLLNAIAGGLALLTWERDSFAYAESCDEPAGRYRGLRSRIQITVTADDGGLLVQYEIARKQIDQEIAASVAVGGETTGPAPPPGASGPTPGTDRSVTAQPAKPRRYHGTVNLDPARVGRDAGRIADEVITHIVGLVGSSVRVTLEIEAEIPGGASDNVVRTVTENSRTLKFSGNSGFEGE